MNSKFSERLKELRLEKGLSQRDLAKAIGVTQPAIVRWENAKMCPLADVIIVFAQYFNVSSDYLLGLED